MNNYNKLKIFNDPIYGFITIPHPLVFDLVEHPFFQRLRRITQMGLSYLVYPGANHTRFHHALGALHLMQKAVQVLRFKGTQISEEEELSLYIAILLHDIGHGPFSHAMEHCLVKDVNHEEISLMLMNQLNKEFDGKLSLAIKVFKGEYHRKFMLQLISSQMDMDRLDYLKRDSFYSGVEEGKINSDRLIQMMRVVNDSLVIEEKGIYSVEKFLIARRLMYWQVYLHKTSLVAEYTLTNLLKRAKELCENGIVVNCSKILHYFLTNKIDSHNFTDSIIEKFSHLDDSDIIGAIKEWQSHPDIILSTMSKMIINRELFKIKMSDFKISSSELKSLRLKYQEEYNFSSQEIKYLVFKNKVKNLAYSKSAEPISILKKNGEIVDVTIISDQLNLKKLSKYETKYFICFPKQISKK